MLKALRSFTAVALLSTLTWPLTGSCVAANIEADQYDYVIAGAGTSGLVLANRLSELADLRVLVIDPGDDQTNNTAVQSIPNWLELMGSSVDWNYNSTAQVHANGRVLPYHAGYGWGGTSLINGMTYIRGQAAEFNAWQYFLDPDGASTAEQTWNWSSLYPSYYKTSESFTPPTLAQMRKGGATYNPSYHGDQGQVKVAFPYELANTSLASVANETFQKLGQRWNADVNGGDVAGFSVWPQTVDRELNVRDDAARAYYNPQIRARQNLRLIKGTVNRIIWTEDQENGAVKANGIEYVESDGHPHTVHVQREVLLCAGSLRSPGILERSGIGNPNILSPLNISVKVNLPGVGENLQDQPNNALIYLSNGRNVTGTAPYSTFVTMRDLLSNDTEYRSISEATSSQLAGWAKTASENVAGQAISAAAFEKIFRKQHALLFPDIDDNNNDDKGNGYVIPAAEILTTASQANLVSAFWTLHPFSRGSVHINHTTHASGDDKNDDNDADATAHPLIDPNFFGNDFDMLVQRRIAQRFLDQGFWRTEPMAQHVARPVLPAPSMNVTTDNEWADFLRQTFNPNYHPLGTCAMQARELGGVVDASLKVYGTEKVRVVDASVLPMQVSGHLTATLYAVAERVADIIKEHYYNC